MIVKQDSANCNNRQKSGVSVHAYRFHSAGTIVGRQL